MAKGVILGVIGCVTTLPALILLFDKSIEKTMHRSLIPKAEGYYDLGRTLPEDMEYVIATTKLQDKFDMQSTHRDGMKQFDEQGIQKLVDAFDGDFKGFIDRLKAIAEVSKDYQSFGGKSSDIDGSVRFIFRTGTIE